MALFVFGAGATRGASFVDPKISSCIPPLDRDFFTQLQRVANPKHQVLVRDVMKDVVDLFGTNFDATMETVFTTLEHTIRMVKATRKTRDFNVDDLGLIKKRLEQSIATVLEESLTERREQASTLNQKECDYHKKIIENIMQTKDSIISFNYDCLLDYSLQQFGNNKWNAHYGYGFNLGSRGARISGDDFWQPEKVSTQKNTIHLYKLHGSLHFKVDNPNDKTSHITLKKRPYTKQHGDSLKFTIIPPESHKEYEKGIFSTLWSKASNAIYKSEHIVLIGYSLPLTDLHSTTLFRTSVRSGKLKSLIVVNPDRDTRRRIRSVFQRGISNQTRILSFDYFSEFLATDRSTWDS